MTGIIPEWADKKAERVLNMFARGDTAAIDRALLHGAFAAALCEEREACATLVEEGFDRVVGESYADDPNVRSKHDKCPHGRYMYEDCEQCCADAIRQRS